LFSGALISHQMQLPAHESGFFAFSPNSLSSN
jgi:hypothetical protein